MKNWIKRKISSLPFLKSRLDLLEHLYVPPGHFYSPLPEKSACNHASIVWASETPLLGIDFEEASQLDFIESCQSYYDELPWKEKSTTRYRFENSMYSYSDGIFYYFILRHYEPAKIIEIGSGWTTGLLLDVRDAFKNNFEVHCVEPFASRLREVIRNEDEIRLTEDIVQNLPMTYFESLTANDILFIDSSHVSKLGSDVNFLFFEVLPRLAKGVLVHVHDIHRKFEYPISWAKEGRGWNEAYILRALLANSRRYQIILASDFLINNNPVWFDQHMPLCTRNSGGSIWLRVNE